MFGGNGTEVTRRAISAVAFLLVASGSGACRARTTTKVDPKSGLEFVHLPGGTFHYGCEPQDTHCQKDEKPGELVKVGPFWLGKTAVTVGAYAKCVNAGACAVPGEGWPKCCDGIPLDRCTWWNLPTRNDHPINCIYWNEAAAFCQWIGGRLPTAEEWEYAAKGGESRIYPWGNDAVTGERTNFCDSACRRNRKYFENCIFHNADCEDYDNYSFRDSSADNTSPVGGYPSGATKDGLFEMVGNVSQWTASRRRLNEMEIRGGSWMNSELDLRASKRFWESNMARGETIGVRCVLSD